MFDNISKTYRPPIQGYFLIRSLLMILDGVLSLAVWPLGWECNLYIRFCEWTLRLSLDRIKVERLAAKVRIDKLPW